MPIAFSAFAMIALVATQQAPLPPSDFDRSIELTEKFRVMLLRRDAQKAFNTYLQSKQRSRPQIVFELRQAGFDYQKNKNDCQYLYGGASVGHFQESVSAFVWLCSHGIGAKIGYSAF